MIDEVKKLLDNYIIWLRKEISLKQIGEWIEITTPYLDRHNDYLQLYIKKENDGFIITDDGYIINDLEICGCPINTPKRKQLLETTLRGFGVTLKNNELQIRTNIQTFPYRKHNLIQAMLTVNDLFYLSEPHIKSLFYEDVVTWLDSNKIRYSPNIPLIGKTGLTHKFDFLISKSNNYPERIIDLMNNPTKERVMYLVGVWNDVKDSRPQDSRAYVILNDTEKQIDPFVEAFIRSDSKIKPISWSKRKENENELAA